ncbi:hypothetical protein [Pseudomonas vranovensis]|uniref:hypothetical protein n=1 Tax=Pseudomonas vranovensis TaxID=321661 RepID=UPI003D99F514
MSTEIIDFVRFIVDRRAHAPREHVNLQMAAFIQIGDNVVFSDDNAQRVSFFVAHKIVVESASPFKWSVYFADSSFDNEYLKKLIQG